MGFDKLAACSGITRLLAKMEKMKDKVLWKSGNSNETDDESESKLRVVLRSIVTHSLLKSEDYVDASFLFDAAEDEILYRLKWHLSNFVALRGGGRMIFVRRYAGPNGDEIVRPARAHPNMNQKLERKTRWFLRPGIRMTDRLEVSTAVRPNGTDVKHYRAKLRRKKRLVAAQEFAKLKMTQTGL